ncbi:heparinase II/III domain-containing protein [Polaribacter batillariae]|uniref:heparinase II/III domain-containing protein n=1 Tax=Polaribacter batillariae TaxID=2808900 RepID=UPI001FB1833F|nr:heparinase II/III family protein [Polaribacter batillariae]
MFFSSEWKNLKKDYDWVTNPSTDFRYDIFKHWSEIPDLAKEAGDIKFVWEKSRFSYLLTILRYDYHFDKNNAEFIFSEIESWIDANPVNQGPNWRCSQEISLRIFNWCFALDYYKNDKALTEERWNKIQNTIYWSLHHVYHHINFSRIAVRNNHAITETLFLTVSELLFPFISETKKWAQKGRKYFEEEINYQIYDDGTFLQFSMNYHRVVIQLLSLGISISEKYDKPFSAVVYQKAYKSLNFLYQCLQEENGYLPNYGSNDGAWFFPLSDTDYRDYRPQLNSLHKLLTGAYFYQDDTLIEDFLRDDSAINKTKPITKKYGIQSFDVGGYYICKTENHFTFIRCGSYKDRPFQSDNLHIDVWVKGKNILRDSGSYKYNTEEKYINYFNGTKGHNAVVVDKHSQMLKGSRFIWFYWTQSQNAHWKETEESYIFEGTIKAFQQLSSSAKHYRKVEINKNDTTWKVYDKIIGLDSSEKKQIWHFDDAKIDWSSTSLKEQKEMSLNSSYYGVKTEGAAKSYVFENEVETTIKYKA